MIILRTGPQGSALYDCFIMTISKDSHPYVVQEFSFVVLFSDFLPSLSTFSES